MSDAPMAWVCPSCHQPTDPSANICDHCRYLHLGRLVAGQAPPPVQTPAADAEAGDSGSGSAAPGWYEDPHGGGERYWDGEKWGEHWVKQQRAAGTKPENDGLATIGWITAILIPFVGLGVGIILSSRNDKRGMPIAITAIAIFVGWILFWVILNAIAFSSAASY